MTDAEQAYVSEFMVAEYNDKSWIMDTGATDHITNALNDSCKNQY